MLGSLGSMFSKTCKTTKTKEIIGPLITKDDNNYKGKKYRAEKREKLGLAPVPKGWPTSQTPPSEPINALQKAKQDDALSDLSNILGGLKGVSTDMGSQLDRKNYALDHLLRRRVRAKLRNEGCQSACTSFNWEVRNLGSKNKLAESLRVLTFFPPGFLYIVHSFHYFLLYFLITNIWYIY